MGSSIFKYYIRPFYSNNRGCSLNFTFRCHRDLSAGKNAQNVYAVNVISFHPKYYTFSTAGADGTFALWDKDAHHCLKSFPSVGAPNHLDGLQP